MNVSSPQGPVQDKQTICVPTTPMVLIAAMATCGLFHASPIGRPVPAARANGKPARWLLRNWERMADTHRKTIRSRIDGLHPRQKGGYGFVALQHEIHLA